MAEFQFITTVKTDTLDHAMTVMCERTGYDEQYEDEDGVEFAYSLSFNVHAPIPEDD